MPHSPSPPPTPTPQAGAHGISFTAPDISAAIAQVRSALGPDAILLNVRRLAPRGIAKLWVKPQIEVIACLPHPETLTRPPAATTPLPSLPITHAAQRYANASPTPTPSHQPVVQASSLPPFQTQEPGLQPAGPSAASFSPTPPLPTSCLPPPSPDPLTEIHEPSPPSPSPAGWRTTAILERLGFTALHAQRVLDHMQRLHGPSRRPPESTAQELALARAALAQLWRPTPSPAPDAPPPLHVLVGPPGTGKSTVLCKWLTQTVLLDTLPARVWRLDGRAPNTAELVSIYGDILQVPVERSWNGRGTPTVIGFVDLPGTDAQDPGALESLAAQLRTLPNPTVHLVLNAAYSIPLLLAQARTFSSLPIADLIITHLDEEPAWGRLWNLVLGTNVPLSFLSAGQNVPGRWTPARPELLCPALFQGN